MALKTKCIKSAKKIDDGVRISVMSRHTLNDGQTPDPTITIAMFDGWFRSLGPPAKLIGRYRRGEADWPTFQAEYLMAIRAAKYQPLLMVLVKLAKQTNVTLLCIEESPEFCHRRLLAEELLRIDPELSVFID